MRLTIRDSKAEVGNYIGDYIADRINDFAPSSEHPFFVLGLPTGSSPLPVYKRLVELYEQGEISFKDVITFNMDEYVGIPEDHPESYHSFMFKHFFSRVDVNPKNTHVLDGNAEDLYQECETYEDKIRAAGGIDLFLGGIGADGHIAFNEHVLWAPHQRGFLLPIFDKPSRRQDLSRIFPPTLQCRSAEPQPGSSLRSRTRIKTLAYDTILDNCRFFNNDLSAVPRMALTVGVQTVMDAREVVLVVTGQNKALALSQMIEGGVNHMVTASALQTHPWALVVCDEDATNELRVKTVKYFKSIEKVQDEVEARYGSVGSRRMGLSKATAA